MRKSLKSWIENLHRPHMISYLEPPRNQWSESRTKMRRTITKKTSSTRRITISIEQWCISIRVIMIRPSQTLSNLHQLCMLKKCSIPGNSSLMMIVREENRKQMMLCQWTHLKQIFQMLDYAHLTFTSFPLILCCAFWWWRSTKRH